MTRTLQRVVLALLVAGAGVVGVWALAAPSAFYARFPGVGRGWIALDGPFNEHLLRDVGGLFLALAAVSALALRRCEPAAVRAAGTGWLVFGIPHLAYHATHLQMFTAGEAAAVVVTLSLPVLLALLLFLPASRRTEVAR